MKHFILILEKNIGRETRNKFYDLELLMTYQKKKGKEREREETITSTTSMNNDKVNLELNTRIYIPVTA